MTLVGEVMPLLFNMPSRLVIPFLPSSKCLLISWLKSPSAVILEPKKIKFVTVSIVSHLFAMKWLHWMPWSSFFECWVLSQLFHCPLLPSSRRSLVPFHFLPLEWYHLHICWISSAYHKLFIFLPAILILACDSLSPAFHQGSLACCSPWGHRVRHNWATELTDCIKVK